MPTNTPQDLYRLAVAFRDAAEADGWVKTPTYETESIERACHLERDGFVISILTRDNSTEPGKNIKYEGAVHAWGPDGLCITPPKEYSGMQYFWDKLITCPECGEFGIPTERYSFAGRCCAKCLPVMQGKHEYPGWSR